MVLHYFQLTTNILIKLQAILYSTSFFCFTKKVLSYLCLVNICHRCCTIYLSTIFRTFTGYGVWVYILYGHRAISLTGFYNRPVQSRGQTMRSYISAAVILHTARAEIVRCLCDSHLFFGIRVPNMYNYSFLI